VGEELFTSMNPVDVKIWIRAWPAFHTSRLRARTTKVPSRPFPWPANRRSRRPPGEGATGWTEVEVAPFGLVVVRDGWAAEVFTEAPAAEVPVLDAPVVVVIGTVAVCEPAEDVVWLLPPQLAGTVTASAAPRTAPTRLHSLRLGELMENLPRRELIGSTGWWREHALAAQAA
jgi:hypothetical protein